MNTVCLAKLIEELESGSRPKGGIKEGVGEVISVGAEHLSDTGGFNFKNTKRIPQAYYESMTHGRISPSDILIVKDGATTGKVSFVDSEFPFNDAAINEHVFRIKVDERKAVPAYIYRYLQSSRGKSAILSDFRGATVGGISRGFVNRIELPLPSLPEQHRIAVTLDKADAVRRKRKDAIKLTESFLRSIFLDMFGDPVANTKNWPRCELGDFLDNIDSGASPRCLDRKASNDEWGILKWGAITKCEYIESDNKALPPDLEPNRNYEVKQGDLLFSRKNTYDLVAACVLVYETRPKLMLPDLIFRLKFKGDSKLHREYVWGLFTHHRKRKQIQSLAGGSAGSMPNISKERLSKLIVEVPPTTLQRQYAEHLVRIRRLIKNYTSALSLSNDLFGSFLQSAFQGDL